MAALPENRFKRAIRAGETQIGYWLALASATSAEIAAGAGFDWILIDMEHGPNELSDVIGQMRAAVGGTAEPVVRVPWNEPVLVKRLLDAGARSFLFPMVQSGDEALAAVRSTRYPPDGIRGMGGTVRANFYARVPDYLTRYGDEICVLVQVESPAGAAAIEDIAAIADVDGIFIGPADLSANMGYPGDAGAPEVRDAITDARERIISAGKPAGTVSFDPATARRHVEEGYAFVAVGCDVVMLARGMDALVRDFKGG